MAKYRKFDEYKEEYFRQHPEEIDDFITIIFEEYAQDGDTASLLTSLRTISRVKGVSGIAEETGISRNGVQKALSENGNPRFESVNAIIHAMGYSLMPQKINTARA